MDPLLMFFVGFLPPASVAGAALYHLLRARSENRVLKVHLEKNAEHFQDKLHLITQTHHTNRTEFEKTLQGLCAQALQANNRAFLDLTRPVLDQFQKTTTQAQNTQQNTLSTLVAPLSHSLENLQKNLQDLEKTRLGAYEGLRTQITDLLRTQGELRAQTGQLVSALRTPHVRGRWGEVQLRRVVELAGMIPHCDFQEQMATEEDEKRTRPDLVIKLPEGRCLAVDAKVPLNSYLDALDAQDENTRKDKMRDHARHIRHHIKILSSRAYWEQFQPAPELVVLFLPGEIFFSAALEYDPQLLDYGANAQVILATPTTLIALLKSVAFGWRQSKLADNAEKIHTLGREVYKRLGDMQGHLITLGKTLGATVNNYNQMVGSLEQRVLPAARRFHDLGVIPQDKILPPLHPIDQQPRTVHHSR